MHVRRDCRRCTNVSAPQMLARAVGRVRCIPATSLAQSSTAPGFQGPAHSTGRPVNPSFQVLAHSDAHPTHSGVYCPEISNARPAHSYIHDPVRPCGRAAHSGVHGPRFPAAHPAHSGALQPPSCSDAFSCPSAFQLLLVSYQACAGRGIPACSIFRYGGFCADTELLCQGAQTCFVEERASKQKRRVRACGLMEQGAVAQCVRIPRTNPVPAR